MSTALTTADSITYDLKRKWRYAIKTILIGLFVGVSIASASGGSIVRQMGLTTLIAAVVSSGSYWVLCRLAEVATGGTGYYRITYPTYESATRVKNESEVGEQETSGESTLMDAQ